MKTTLLKIFLFTAMAMPFASANAQIFPPLTNFDSSQGVLKIPTLLFEGRVYYLELSVADAANLTMKIEESSLVDVTPDSKTEGKTTDDIVGTWTTEDNTELTFNSDGTWMLSQPASADAESCPDGGDESGTFRYSPSTGVFFPFFQVDENGECGLSHTGGMIRIYLDGNTLSIVFTDPEEDPATLTRVE